MIDLISWLLCFLVRFGHSSPQCSRSYCSAGLDLNRSVSVGPVHWPTMLARLIAAAASGGEAAPVVVHHEALELALGLEESAAAARARRARRYNASKANADKQFKHVIKMANKTQQENCTNLNFGHGNSSCKDTYERFSQEANALDGVASEVVDKTKQTQSAIVRGLASHLKAVRQKLVDLFNKTSYVIVADVSDEASMWCRRSLTSDELKAAKAAAAKAKAATNKKKCVIVMLPRKLGFHA